MPLCFLKALFLASGIFGNTIEDDILSGAVRRVKFSVCVLRLLSRKVLEWKIFSFFFFFSFFF